MTSDDLSYLFDPVEIVMPLRFEDADGNVFFGGLQMDQRDFDRVCSYPTCPRDKQSMEYYEYLRDNADAIPCSPDIHHPPLTKHSPHGGVLAVYMYGVNAQNILDLHIASQNEICIAARASSTYFMTAFLWNMHMEAVKKLLPAPRR